VSLEAVDANTKAISSAIIRKSTHRTPGKECYFVLKQESEESIH